MLGYSVSYFLSNYWRNVPLYAEKLIPLLDTCLSSGFVYSDKVAGAFYELTNKYQNTEALPLENLKEFIRENGYGYVLDLMIQDEENIKLLWYLLVLIHQLKGSREGLELVLSMFQEQYTPEKQSLISTLGEPTVTSTSTFLSGMGTSLLTEPLTVNCACPSGSNGWFNYELPAGSYISDAGTYTLSWTNLSFQSLGKFNSMTITATCANTDEVVLFDEDDLLFTYPEKVLTTTFTMEEGASPIKSLKFEYTCDNFNQVGACIANVNIKKGGVTYLPVTTGIITSDGKFYGGYNIDKAFHKYYPFGITGYLSINNNVVNGFNNGCYVTSSSPITFSNQSELGIKFTYIKNQAQQSIISLNNTIFGLDIYINESSKLVLSVGDGADATETLGSTELTAINSYWIKFTYDGNNYKVLLSTDGTSYVDEITYASATQLIPDNKYINIGINYNGTLHPFAGSLDLSQFYVKIDGTSIQMPYKEYLIPLIISTAPTKGGSITLVYPNSLDAGLYELGWNMLSYDTARYIKSMKIAIRYNEYNAKDVNKEENTLEIYNNTNLSYIYNNKEFRQEFRALKAFNQIYIEYELNEATTTETIARAFISNLDIYKDSDVITVKTIPSMTSNSTPKGSVVTNASFASEHEAFKVFNYTDILPATPTADGYVKYSYEASEMPTLGDYTFMWANSSTDNNAYLTSLRAVATYIDGSTQTIAEFLDLQPVTSKTRYYTKFSASNTIKSVTVYYTSTYVDGEGGSFSEVNITKTKEGNVNGTGIDVWYESLPVSVENTFELTTSVDIGKTGSEFFYNFRNFVRHYVYPELLRLKVKYNLEGVQAQRVYSRSKIDYASDVTVGNILTINTVPSNAVVTMAVGGKTIETKSINVDSGTSVTYTITCPYYNTLTETVTVNSSMTLTKTLTEYAKYTITLNPIDSETSQAITGSTYSITSDEGTSLTNQITVHDGTAIEYTVYNPYYETTSGTKTVTATETVNVSMAEKPEYTITFNVRDSITQGALTGVTYSLSSQEKTSTTNSITVHSGILVSYTISKSEYETVTGNILALNNYTVTVDLMQESLTVGEIHETLTVDEMNRVKISQVDGSSE